MIALWRRNEDEVEHLAAKGVVRGAHEATPQNFLEYLVMLCFERPYPEQNTVVSPKSKLFALPPIPPSTFGWLRHC